MIAERERFAKNLALMASGPIDSAQRRQGGPMKLVHEKETQSDAEAETLSRSRVRWIAIRDHISRTMETKDSRFSSK